MGKLNPNFIVGIGGSAGGLHAYMALLDALPSDTGMAFVVVSHIVPDAISQLALILSRHTKMKVTAVSTAKPIHANQVYVCPPNTDLLIEGGQFKVVSPCTKKNTQVDVFLTSLAQAMGTRAMAVIFSGYGSDGTEGCRHIKEKGGITFAQDISAEVNFMPDNAQVSGFVDFVLPPDKIADQLQKLAKAR